MDNNTTNDSNFNSIGEFIDSIIDEQGYTTLDAETRENLKAEMMQRLIDQIDRAAIDRLPEDKATELANKLDNGELSDEQVSQFMVDSGVNLQQVALETMIQFKMLYQGGGASDEVVTPPVEEMKAKINSETVNQ